MPDWSKEHEHKWDGDFRSLTCKRCDKNLDVRSHFLPITKNRVHRIMENGKPWIVESSGIEIHVRCINSDCDESNHEKNPDYFTPIFVGAI